MMKEISSTKNPLVKLCVELSTKSKLRTIQDRFVFEGLRELSLAVQGGYVIERILFVPQILPLASLKNVLAEQQPELIAINKEVYAKLSYRSSTEGVIVLARVKNHGLENITFAKHNPLILVAEASEKPGNIGALLRTADAAALDAVLIANPKTDIYNPNIIRSSVGCVFTTPIAVGSTAQVLSFLQKKNISIYCTALTASSKPYTSINFTQGSAIVVGTEDVGLSADWLSASTQNIIIPMRGVIDSLNVSVAAGAVVFEAIRQRLGA